MIAKEKNYFIISFSMLYTKCKMLMVFELRHSMGFKQPGLAEGVPALGGGGTGSS